MGLTGLLSRLTTRLRRPRHLRVIAAIEGMITLREADLLYELARTTDAGCILEVGSYRGRSTVALAMGSLRGHQRPVYAIDPHEEFVGLLGGRFGPQDRAEFFKAMLSSSCYRLVRLVNLRSEVVAPGWSQPIGLLWIDGDHSYEGVRSDWGCWSPHLGAGARIAFHDSASPELGPARLTEELVAAGRLTEVTRVGQTRVFSCASALESVAPSSTAGELAHATGVGVAPEHR